MTYQMCGVVFVGCGDGGWGVGVEQNLEKKGG